MPNLLYRLSQDPDILVLDLKIAIDYPFEYIIREIYAQAKKNNGIILKFDYYIAEVTDTHICKIYNYITRHKIKQGRYTSEDILKTIINAKKHEKNHPQN